jgi:hypothetical protein
MKRQKINTSLKGWDFNPNTNNEGILPLILAHMSVWQCHQIFISTFVVISNSRYFHFSDSTNCQ